jgi:hypothetical protein
MVSADLSDPPRRLLVGRAGFVTTAQGYWLAASNGGVLTKWGADIILNR